MTTGGPPARRSVFVAEVAALVAATAVDGFLVIGADEPQGALGSLITMVVPYAGQASAVLAVLRRRFPRRVELLGGSAVALSLISTAVGGLVAGTPRQPPVTEVLALLLLAAAGCRRLPPARAAVLAVAACAAGVLAPIARYGLGYPVALFSVAAALAWGVAVALGLILRDADARHRRELERIRTEDRLQLARDLHDLVAHHVTGIVVRTRAAQALIANPAAPPQDPLEVYDQIEQAAAEALTATRGLVGVLRSDEPLPSPSLVLGDVVRGAVGDEASVHVADDVEALPLPAQVSVALHRVLLEALTNTRRHARATEVRVAIRSEDGDLVLDVDNDGVPAGAPAEGGHGVLGMAERMAALGGELTAGPHGQHRWRVTARLPLGPEDDPFDTVPRGL
ncbi:Signal transduction histidine kinase [Lentzea xinjiangensis]|uniref:histidine kinase n=1 Tax=Lentzea xinjiangensis TaxID=402600 RepID=A0A1H9JYY7_9PSEU|nr:histidine kinase [Lentzea xinjiangensis]SEQ92176.1 Signal transduction histidine kinase [Lentzea xinjiangensis]